MNDGRLLVCPVIIGRDDLLELAERRISEVSAGSGLALLIAGEAGVGKTRLVGSVERLAAGAGFRVIRGGTYPSDLQVPGAVLLDVARAMRRSEADTLRTLGASLEERLAVDDAATGGDPHRRRRLLVLDLVDLLLGIAMDGDALLILEDLHWSDDLTLSVLETLAGRVAEQRLLVIATYRSDELYPSVPVREWRARLLGRRQAEEVKVRRLDPGETGRMIRLLGASREPAGREVVEAIHARTDGIPLHVEEFMALLADEPRLDPEVVRRAGVPETVDAAIEARIARRSERARAIARAGAVIGRAFDLDLLVSVVDLPADELADGLGELETHFILQPSRTPGRYVFRHALICDTIYDAMPVPERRALHAVVADAAAPRPDVGTNAFLSLHFERAGRHPDAFLTASAGAAMATAISSHREARALLECALRTAPPDLAPADRARILEAHARAAAATDDNALASESFEGARAAYLAAGLRVDAAAVVAPLVEVRHLLGDDLGSRVTRLRAALGEVSAATTATAAASDADRSVVRVQARLTAAIAAAFMLDRRLEESVASAEAARDLAVLGEDAAVDRHATTTLGVCHVFSGRMDDGWALLERVVEECRKAHLEAETARAYRMIGSSASVLVEYEIAERWLREGIAYAEGVELWNHRHYMAAHLAHVLWATGRWEEAAAVASHALADGRGGITTRITALHVLGFVALGRDDLPEAETVLGEARELGSRMGELQRLSPALWGLAEAALAAHEPARAVALAEEAFAASAAVDDAAYLFPFVVTGVRAHLALQDPSGARAWFARTRGRLERRGIPGAMTAVDHATGLLALADGSTAKAREALSAAADRWAASGRAWEGAWALVDLAEAHRRANLGAAAVTAARAAVAAADRLGADRIREAASPLARSGPLEPDPWSPLTLREFEVARLVADGGTNVEIAKSLGVARKTVASHIEHILTKLDARRRAEIAAWAASVPGATLRRHDADREE